MTGENQIWEEREGNYEFNRDKQIYESDSAS